ncbi:ImcF-related family protein [Collimonas antrihumi]|uniref:ImcF-related family protein n=1 Tax=Collimonas antrihumi TaxID=1940615 RepID=UPI001B8C2CB7|nr:ImcF-related family protein [Collimonas antrihumi]
MPKAVDGEGNLSEIDPLKQRIAALKEHLQETHGWRWRYRDRWLLLCGEPTAIDQLAPTLRRNGWAITPHAVLLYGGKRGSTDDAGDIPDIDWLRQIARIRRRRPVDAVVAVIRSDDKGGITVDRNLLTHQLHLQSRALGWAAPSYVLNASEVSSAEPDVAEVIGCTWSGHGNDLHALDTDLSALSHRLAERGVSHLAQQLQQPYLVQLSRMVNTQRTALTDLIARLAKSRARSSAVHGVLFAPLFKPTMIAVETESAVLSSPSPWQEIHWQAIAAHSRQVRGRSVGFSLSATAAWGVTVLLGLWIAGSLISGASNRTSIADASEVVTRLQGIQRPVIAAMDLDALQKQIDTLEVRQREGTPWYTRFGLNHSMPLLNALWPHYQAASQRTLTAPLQHQLEANLQQRNGMSDQELADGGEAQVKVAYAELKAYLMLAHPQRTEPAFLIPHWLASGQPAMASQSILSAGGWHDLRQRLITFHANHLAAHEDWAIAPDAVLAGSARQSLIAVIGLQHSTDVQYQSILDENSSKYQPVSLQTLLGNNSSRGLFSTSATVPGIFTRAAWDERISKAIDDADKQRNVDHDWVLSDSAAADQTQATGSELKEALRHRYFADYARAWEIFLNSVQWQNDSTLSGTIDQLTLLADAQRSPLSALFKAIAYQAGAGTVSQSLSDNLVNKAKQLVSSTDPDPSKATLFNADDAPLAAAFGPLLRLSSSNGAAAGSTSANAAMGHRTDMSLVRYLERVTAVRLKLQQIMMSSDPDAMSRTTAQSILQGKTSDITDSRDYASRVGASVGEQWSGFGRAVFERPLEQTWGVVLRPAAASLNATWRSAIVSAWHSAFSGRYPFVDADNDASLPELARFLRAEGGLIPQFVATQLAGMLERQGDQWVPTQGAGGNALRLDPNFIEGLNRLTRISNRLFPEGDAKVRFELKPVATGGVTDMRLKSGAQSLHYFNQREEWHPMIWPGEAVTGDSRLEWRTENGGLRSELNADGRFGLIRLLSHAEVTQVDGAQYLLTWQAGGSDGVALRMLLRSEAGGGPLDVLALRNFVLPQQIFASGQGGKIVTKEGANEGVSPAPVAGKRKASL